MFENLTPRNGLPSLNALRAFEAMGRTGSATRAAAELSVTHSAVSRQVKALEAALGVRLFEGPKHRLRLTAQGRTLLKGLTAGFDAVSEAVRGVREVADVHLAIHPSLAVKWLIPRLTRFERDCPGVALHLTDLGPAETRRRDVDLVVRLLDREASEAAGVERLIENRVGLVCTPALAAAGLARAARLSAHTHPQGWRDWAAASGQPLPAGPERLLAHLHFVLDAALAGLGSAVLPWIIVADDVASGRLAAPFGFVPDCGVLAAIRTSPADGRPARAVVRWLRAEAEATARLAPAADQPA